MRVLVIGGMCFMGPYVVHALHQMGHQVGVLHKGSRRAKLPPGIEVFTGERCRLRAHTETFARFAPDVVVDMTLDFEQDARALVETFTGIAGRVVILSSADVYQAFGRLLRIETGPPDSAPLREDAPLRSRLYPYREQAHSASDWLYNYDKIPVERVVRSAALPATILRLPIIYGPGDYKHRLHPYLQRMDDGRPAILIGAGLANWRASRVYVENAAAAVALAVDQPIAAGGVYNIADDEAPTQLEWIAQIAEAAEWDGEIIILPEEQLPAHLGIDLDTRQDWVLDSAHIRASLGYIEPVSQLDAMQQAVEWARANPPHWSAECQEAYAEEDRALALAAG